MTRFTLPKGLMQIDGKELLRIIQNSDMPEFDLIARESVQNSLDASADHTSPVHVSFITKTVDQLSEKIANFIPDLKKGLTDKYPGRQTILEIRDSGTTGLTGPASMADNVSGNWSKLVYQISQPQEQRDAGGSWGMGKTVYYRAGAGLVFFYSRIRTKNAEYIERLSASLVEDACASAPILPGTASGISWWGGDNRISATGQEFPTALEDPSRIHQILDELGIQKYSNKDTGTSIIIPFLKNDNLPVWHEQANAWYGGIEGYIKHALLKWYAVRLENRIYSDFHKKSPLVASVNGTSVTKDMAPVFHVIRGLYNHAYTKKWNDSLFSLAERNILHRAIAFNSCFEGDRNAGTVVAAKLNRSQLQMVPPNNMKTPHTYLLQTPEQDTELPLLGYLRSPGMIVSWNDPQWTKQLKNLEDDDFIIALFIPESTKILNEARKRETGCSTLEEYLRSRENADHAQWTDSAKISVKIIERVRRSCQNAINNFFFDEQPDPADPNQDDRLARMCSDAFLPEGFGTDCRTFNPKKNQSKDTDRRRGGNARLSLQDLKWSQNVIRMKWKLDWGNRGCSEHVLQLNVASELSTITPKQWKDELSPAKFPFAFGEFIIDDACRPGEVTLTLKDSEQTAKDSSGIIEAERSDEGCILQLRYLKGKSPSNSSLTGTMSVKILSDNQTLCPQIRLEPGS